MTSLIDHGPQYAGNTLGLSKAHKNPQWYADWLDLRERTRARFEIAEKARLGNSRLLDADHDRIAGWVNQLVPVVNRPDSRVFVVEGDKRVFPHLWIYMAKLAAEGTDKGADLYRADLSGANLSGAYRPADVPAGYVVDKHGYLDKAPTTATHPGAASLVSGGVADSAVVSHAAADSEQEQSK